MVGRVLLVALSLLRLPATEACTDFYMPCNGSQFRISVRTMDLGFEGDWQISVHPRGKLTAQTACTSASLAPVACNGSGAAQWTSKFGYVGFSAPRGGFPWNDTVGEGMNEKGLSCGALALLGVKQPEATTAGTNVHVNYLCQWALELFSTVEEVKTALGGVTVWGPNYVHWIFRDSSGKSLVVEFRDGTAQLWDDPNDGKSGFGIMTNEPFWDWHVTHVQHLQWKHGLARQAIPVPGSWYPEDRFMRTHMVKSAMPPPRSLQHAMAQAVATLNTVTVPEGTPPGTDSGLHSGEGEADHTLWGVVRDHANLVLYWRSDINPSLQRLRFSDLDFSVGAAAVQFAVREGDWFLDTKNKLNRLKAWQTVTKLVER